MSRYEHSKVDSRTTPGRSTASRSSKYAHQKKQSPLPVSVRTSEILRPAERTRGLKKSEPRDQSRGDSLKSLYCDRNDDGYVDILFRRYRNPAVRKFGICSIDPADVDTDSDGAPDLIEAHPLDPNLTTDALPSTAVAFDLNTQYKFMHTGGIDPALRTPPETINSLLQGPFTRLLKIPPEMQGKDTIVTAGITLPSTAANFALVQDYEFTITDGGTSGASSVNNSRTLQLFPNEVYFRDHGSIDSRYGFMMFMRFTVPYFDNNKHVSHAPIALGGHYPLYRTFDEAIYRANLYNPGSGSVTPVSVDYRISDNTTLHPLTNTDVCPIEAGTGSRTFGFFKPDLPLADASTALDDFSKSFSPSNFPHPGLPVLDQGWTVINQPTRYDVDGNIMS